MYAHGVTHLRSKLITTVIRKYYKQLPRCLPCAKATLQQVPSHTSRTSLQMHHFAVHKDFKSHGSILISCGHGFVWCKCATQKIVTKSSTEAELVSLSDAVSMSAWAVQFLEGQGCNVKANQLQDNLSTIALASNGSSTSDRTRHINIKQYLENGSMVIQHCPATDMIADILTKLLQGYDYIKCVNF